MTTKTIGFIGGGRIARILLEGWARAQTVPHQITVSDPNTEGLAVLKERYPRISTSPDNAVAAAREIVLIAVHPPVLAETVAAIKSSIQPGAWVVSLAPKFTLAKLSMLLGGWERVGRVIPNAPSLIGAGYNPMAFAPGIPAAEKKEIVKLFEPLGESREVAEEKLEAYAILTAMGPTYLWFQLQALREVAATFGLSEEEITPALKRMVCGGARTLLESGLSPAEVMDLIPVKPLAEMEGSVAEMYRTKLPALFLKIKP